MARYVYDAWGNHEVLNPEGTETALSTFIGNINPIRYRGYYYDTDIKLYYLINRYYDPTIGQFISPDSAKYLNPEEIGGVDLYAYCLNNPIMYIDPNGHWIETVFDLFSLGVSIVEVVINPCDPLAWVGLAGDAIDLIPFVTGVGETVRGVKVVAKGVDLADNALDTIKIVKATDFTNDAYNTIRGLGKIGDYTKSTMSAGRDIHKGFKIFGLSSGKEFIIKGGRIDYLDIVDKKIFELKPANPRGVRSGVVQLLRYKNKLGREYSMILELYFGD